MLNLRFRGALCLYGFTRSAYMSVRLRRHHASQTLLSSDSEKSICAPADWHAARNPNADPSIVPGLPRPPSARRDPGHVRHVHQAGDCRSNGVLANEANKCELWLPARGVRVRQQVFLRRSEGPRPGRFHSSDIGQCLHQVQSNNVYRRQSRNHSGAEMAVNLKGRPVFALNT